MDLRKSRLFGRAVAILFCLLATLDAFRRSGSAALGLVPVLALLAAWVSLSERGRWRPAPWLAPCVCYGCLILAERLSGTGRPSLAVALIGVVAALVVLQLLLFRLMRSELFTPAEFALCMASFLLGYFSGSRGGADPMVAWLIDTFGWTPDFARAATVAFRKAIHFTAYGSLATLAAFAILQRAGALRSALQFGLAWALSFALFDEIRQYFSPGRLGSIWDVALDMSGALCFLTILYLSRRHKQLRPEGPAGIIQSGSGVAP